jgi:hypothetical protein
MDSLMERSRLASLAWFAALCGVAPLGCVDSPNARAVMPNGGADTTALAKCRVAASHDEPLVTEWPASYKARLEAMLHHGAVAVAYSGCELRIVEACALRGSYEWRRTTLSRDSTDIGNEDELYAKLPLGADGLSSTLRSAGSLHVLTTVSGQMQLTDSSQVDAGSMAACSQATHVVTALSVGAFKLVAGGEVGAKLKVGPLAGGSAEESATILREAGDPTKCASATSTEPNADCRSPIQVFLAPLARGAAPKAGPEAGGLVLNPFGPLAPAAPAADEGPRAPGAIHASFRTPFGDSGTWTFRDGSGATLCKLPCTRWVVPAPGYVLVRESPMKGEPDERVPFPAETPYKEGADVGEQLVAPVGSTAWGIGLTVGGAAATAIGIGVFAASSGASGDQAGPIIAATLLGSFGIAGVVLGIPLMIKSHGWQLEAIPGGANPFTIRVGQQGLEVTNGGASVSLSPGGIQGRF